ncbi:MAG: transposase, partial [Gammaproteobacteria bacterium]
MAFIDSTEIPVCHRKRIKQHKVFANEATLGKSSKGWFLGFKLHLVANHKGELVA